MKRKSAKPALLTLDCLDCETTWYYRTAGPHRCDCGGVLRVRREDAVPFEPGSYEDQPAAPKVSSMATLPLFAAQEPAA